MSEIFSTARALELIRAGEIVRINLASTPSIDPIRNGAIETFGHVRDAKTETGLATCFWAIRQEDYCVPFVFFDQIDDYRLWQSFMLFDRFRETKPEYAIPALLIGDRDIFGDELGGKASDVLSSKVTHLEPR